MRRATPRSLLTYLVPFLLGVAPIAALGVFAYRVAAQSNEELVRSNNRSAVSFTRELVEQEFNHHISTLKGLAANPGFMTVAKANDEEGVRGRLAAIVDANPSIVRAFITKPDGVLWSDYPRAPESLGLGFADRDWYTGLTQQWQPYVSSVYRRNAAPQILLVAVAVPVRDASGSVIGALVCQIGLNNLSALLRSVEVGVGGHVFLVDYRGNLAAHPTLDLQSKEHLEYAGNQPVLDSNTEPLTSVFVDPLSGHEVLAKSVKVDITGRGWTIVAQQPTAEAFAASRQIGWQIAGAGALVALLLGASALLLARYHNKVGRLNTRLDAMNKELTGENAERRRTFETLLANLPGMVYRRNNPATWTMDFASQGCEALTGFKPNPLSGYLDKSWDTIVHADDLPRLRAGVDAALAQREPYTCAYRILTAGNTEKWVWDRGCGIFSPDGRLMALEGVVNDITEQKLLEAQLLQAQKMEAIGRLAGGVAHDFNNMLTVISGYSELALLKAPKDSPLRSQLDEIHGAAKRAAALTRQLLAFSRKQVMQGSQLDLNAVVDGMNSMLRRLIGEDIDLVIKLAPGLDLIHADAAQIEQIVMNLVVNARDAMETGGKLTIETGNVTLDDNYARAHPEAKAGRHVLLAVSDTGSGMDAATKARIFEPFFTTKGIGKGTGLGLPMVYGIVKQSGGNIWVYSEVGHGTTFKIYLPGIGKPDGASSAQAVLAPASAGKRGTETILVCEDEAGVRALVCDVLGQNGYTVLAAADSEDAQRLAREHRGEIHALLTDVVMPKMGGRELGEKIRAIRPGTRVIYMSGYTDDAIVRHGVLEEGAAFIEKPVAPDVLLEKVRKYLG